ncbi:MAG: 3-deoxy-manno-octulosonate cytidylyltransferase [Planctomycetia bacterium]|nr:3-deoxy-manno-octulosonate cytidylyltransferase [Planctomycetia bacterium]
MRKLIVIPARYGSKRFPGKPLALLEGKTLLQRTWEIANYVKSRVDDCDAVVATETPSEETRSDLIIDFCNSQNIPIVVTSNQAQSGSDRVWEVALQANVRPEIIVNLQGDLPTCPPTFILDLMTALEKTPSNSVASVFVQLSWHALDALRKSKLQSPFSGTTVVVNANNRALWFSKQIIPAIRNEEKWRETSDMSPVRRHIGLYAYRYEALQFFAQSPKSQYERLEQLEQLRFLENGYTIQMVEGIYPPGYDAVTSGVDSPEDLERVAKIIRENGELLDFYA